MDLFWIAKLAGPTLMSQRKLAASRLSLEVALSPLEVLAPAPQYEFLPLTILYGANTANQTTAGVFALLNDFRLSQGKSTLGFINPLIYSTASSGFNDITAGSNPGCNTRGN